MSGGRAVERVLCVRREDVFPEGAWHGFAGEGLEPARRAIRERSFFMPRAEVEHDPGYQQVIPYAVFRHRDRYLLTRRLAASSEARLRRLCSLGVGGHVNPADAGAGDPVLAGLRREWEEEVSYAGAFEARPLGLINDDSSPVSSVHLGVVFLVEGDTPDIAIRETRKLSGELLTPAELRLHYLEMESWSQIVYDALVADGLPSLPRRRAPG